MVETNTPVGSPGAGHELSDLSPKNIALFAVVLTLIIIAALVVTYALFQRFLSVATKTRAVPSPLSYTREATPEPHLLINPGQDLKTMRADEDKILNTYDWVDREKGIVRIPIRRAIEILAQRGLPARRNGNGTEQSNGKSTTPGSTDRSDFSAPASSP